MYRLVTSSVGISRFNTCTLTEQVISSYLLKLLFNLEIKAILVLTSPGGFILNMKITKFLTPSYSPFYAKLVACSAYTQKSGP